MARRLVVSALVALFACAFVPAQEFPKGSLIIIGGGKRGPAIMNEFVRLAGGKDASIAIFPMASAIADSMENELSLEFKRLGAREVRYLNISRMQAETDSIQRQLESSTGVYLPGGDQSRLMNVLRNTRTARTISQRYQAGAAICGTSAGAAVMSRIMITGDERVNRDSSNAFPFIRAGNIVTTDGLGFLDDVIVDQHFIRRKRHNRLLTLLLEHPDKLAVGIDEATAMVVRPDRTFEVVGDATILVLDASRATATTQDSNGDLASTQIRLHLLKSGIRFNLVTREPILPPHPSN